MLLRASRDADGPLFQAACANDRLETVTCRPIGNGRRMEPDPRRVDWTLTDADSDGVAGWFLLFDFNSRNRSSEFGFGLVPAYRGKGFAMRLLTAAFDRTFEEFDLNKIYCQTASFNRGAFGVLEELGLVRDGVLRAHHELDGRLYDDYIYSLLREEWAGRTGGVPNRSDAASIDPS